MSEKEEIIFMQTRLVRLASKEWHLPVDEIFNIFGKADVLGYIEKCYGIFHCEGDDAVLEDSRNFFKERGSKLVLDFTDGLILYHGSYCEVKKPLLERCARRKDFGPPPRTRLFVFSRLPLLKHSQMEALKRIRIMAIFPSFS